MISVGSGPRQHFDELLDATLVDRDELVATVVAAAAVPYCHHMLNCFSYFSRIDMKF